jgi:hypothetical protein
VSFLLMFGMGDSFQAGLVTPYLPELLLITYL